MDVQEVTVSGGVHDVVLSDAVDARSPPAEPVVSGQQFFTEPAASGQHLLTEEEIASPCVSDAEEKCTDGQPAIAEASSPFSNSTVPLSKTSSLVIPEVSTSDTHITNDVISTYKLPPRQNRGVPPNRFSPEGKVKYPIANYVSCKNLSSERQAWVNNVDSIQVPTRVEDALKSREWTEEWMKR